MLSRLVFSAAAILAFVGCASSGNADLAESDGPEAPGQSVSPLLREGLTTDVSWWTHDDEDGEDSTYLAFDGQTWSYGDGAGVFVDFPACANTAAFVASFTGMARGDWQYRASLRLTVEQNGLTQDVHGAQGYFTPTDGVDRVAISGVFTAPGEGPCRVGIKGRTFTGKFELFGGATFVVERHR